MPDTYSAHNHASRNQAEILNSNGCACFDCNAVFPQLEGKRAELATTTNQPSMTTIIYELALHVGTHSNFVSFCSDQ